MPQEAIPLPLSHTPEGAKVHKSMEQVAAEIDAVLGEKGKLVAYIPLAETTVHAKKVGENHNDPAQNQTMPGVILIVDRPGPSFLGRLRTRISHNPYRY